MPTRGNTHIDRLINNLMTARFFNHNEAIAMEAFPKVVVNRPSDKFPKLNSSYLRKDDDRLGPKGRANTVNWDFDTPGSFYIDDFGFNTTIDGRTYRDADESIKRKYRQLAARIVTDKLVLQREVRAANALFNTSTFSGRTSALTGTDRLDDPASDIFDIIGEGIESARTGCGRRPNCMVMGGAVWSAIQRHPDMRNALALDKMKSMLDVDQVQAILSNKRMKFEKVLVGDMQYNTAAEGLTASYSDIWGKFLFIGYVDFNAITELDQSCTKSFVEKGREGVKVKFYKESENEDELSEDCRASVSYDLQVIDANCGYLYSTVVS